jgi:hypothetical protein
MTIRLAWLSQTACVALPNFELQLTKAPWWCSGLSEVGLRGGLREPSQLNSWSVRWHQETFLKK